MQTSTTTVSAEVMPNRPTQTSPYSRDNVRNGVFHYLLGRGMSGVASFASVILLVRHMDVESYAGYTALTGLIMMAGVLAGLGLERALARYIPEGRMHHPAKSLRRFIWTTCLLRFLVASALTAVIIALWPFVVRVFEGIRLEAFPLPLACFLIATSLFQHFSTVLQSLVLQKILTRILVIQWAGRLGMILALIAIQSGITLEQSLWVMAAPEMAGIVAFVLVTYWHLRGLIRQRPPATQGKQPPWPRWGDVMRMAMHNYGYNLLAAPPQGYFMRILAAALLPPPFVAAYGFFLSLVERLRQYLPVQLLYNIIEPVIIANYIKNEDFRKSNTHIVLLYRFNLLCMVPVIAWVGSSGSHIINLITGGKYESSAWLLLISLIHLFFSTHAMLLQLLVNATGSSKVLLRSAIGAATVAILYIGVAIFSTRLVLIVFTPVLFAAINNSLGVLFFRRNGYDYEYNWPDVIKSVLAGLIAWVLTWVLLLYLPSSQIYVAVLAAIIAAFVFFMIAFAIRLFSVDDLTRISFLLKARPLAIKG